MQLLGSTRETFQEVAGGIAMGIEAVGILIIAVRTFLSFALEVEINGHWPWQRAVLSKQSNKACGIR